MATDPDPRVTALSEAMAADGARGVVDHIMSLAEHERLPAFSAAQQLFGTRGSAFVSFGEYVRIVRAGIDEALRRAGSEPDPTRAAQLTDTANVFSFNLSAELADCWPDDPYPRGREQFEEGLRAADDCIRWREELGKPGDRKAMAWWARGTHLMRLGRIDEAVDSYRSAAQFVAAPAGVSELTTESTFDQLINVGYEALARSVRGDERASEDYERVIEVLESQLDDEEKKEDAQFGIDQLRVMETRVR